MKKKIISSKSFGSVVVLWDIIDGEPKVFHIFLPSSKTSAEKRASAFAPAAQQASCEQIDSLAKLISASLSGEDVSFPPDILNWKQCTAFQKKVLRADCRIPLGCVSSYQRIAAKLGDKNASRAVGNALANNPFPIVVPCHRVVCSDRRLGGFQGGLDAGIKKRLLENEGVIPDSFLRIPLSHFVF